MSNIHQHNSLLQIGRLAQYERVLIHLITFTQIKYILFTCNTHTHMNTGTAFIVVYNNLTEIRFCDELLLLRVFLMSNIYSFTQQKISSLAIMLKLKI